MNTKPIRRRCIACRKLLDRQQLWRIVRDHQDGVVLDSGMGRSAYLCPNKNCLEQTRRQKRLPKALRCKVPPNVIEVLQKRLSHSNDAVVKAI